MRVESLRVREMPGSLAVARLNKVSEPGPGGVVPVIAGEGTIIKSFLFRDDARGGSLCRRTGKSEQNPNFPQSMWRAVNLAAVAARPFRSESGPLFCRGAGGVAPTELRFTGSSDLSDNAGDAAAVDRLESPDRPVRRSPAPQWHRLSGHPFFFLARRAIQQSFLRAQAFHCIAARAGEGQIHSMAKGLQGNTSTILRGLQGVTKQRVVI